MTNKILQTPFDFSEPVKAGRRRFWKQILPVTEIDYKGQKVNFDPSFHKNLELAYEDKVFDQIPLVFADGENRHNEDPRNFGGEIVHMENRGDAGTWALIEADRQAAKVIQRNPRLGVSARITQGVEKGGKMYNAAVRHVLMTMFPRVQGMSPWQAVDLSDEDEGIEVVDLTAETYNKEEGVMGQPKTTSKGKIDLSSLSDEQFQRLLDLAATAVDEDTDEDLDDDEIEDLGNEDLEVPEASKPKKKKSKTKITVEKESEGDSDDDDEDDDEDEDTDLSDSDHVIKAGERSQFQQMRLDLSAERWDREKQGYIEAGVPPFLLDLAEPLLSLPDAVTIDLSDGEDPLDASATIRKMLDGTKGLVDLGVEIGTAIDMSDALQDQDDESKFLQAWDNLYG